MGYYYIVCRSLTYAQRTAAVLNPRGITARVVRAPRSIAVSGCSYTVRISKYAIAAALAELNQAGLAPVKVYLAEDGVYQEVPL